MRGVTGYLNGMLSELATGLTAYEVVADPPAICLAELKAIRSGEISLCLHPMPTPNAVFCAKM